MISRHGLVCAFKMLVMVLLGVVFVAERARAEWAGVLTAEGVYTDNVRSQEGAARRGEFYTVLGGGISWGQSKKRFLPAETSLLAKGRLFSESPEFNYYEIRPRATFAFGRNQLELEYVLTPDRLFFDRSEDVGPRGAFYTGHTFAGRVSRKLGERKRLRVYLSWDLIWRNFAPPDDARDDFTVLGEVRMRYRVAPIFVPEVAFEYGRRNAVRNNFDRNQARLAVGFESRLTSWLVVKVRYKYSHRDYTVGSDRVVGGSRNRNFGRVDNRQDFEGRLAVPVPYVDGLSLRVRYKYRASNSSRPGRTFTRNEVGVELAYVLRGISW